MKHLEDEDIAGMIEGKTGKKERETFLKHLSECSACFNVYTETLKFVEGDKKKKVPRVEKIKAAVQRFREGMGNLAENRRPLWVPAFAALIVILATAPFVVNYLHHKGIEKNKLDYIGQSVLEIENNGILTFSGSKGKIYAALRAGIFAEDLFQAVNSGANEELKRKIVKLLDHQLNAFGIEGDALPRELENIEGKNVEAVVQRIHEVFENRSYPGLFRFGRFLEQSILYSFENKRPHPEEIETYLRIAREYDLPPGVLKEFNKLKPTYGAVECKTICSAVKEIFLE